MTNYSPLLSLRRVFAPAVHPLLACLALAAVAVPAHAGEAAGGTAAPVLAVWTWWFWLGYFSNVGSRGNVVMLCLAIFGVSLLILMSATRRS